MTNIKKYPKGHLSKADRKKRTIAKTVIALGMILGIGIVISSNFLYSGIQYFTQKAKNHMQACDFHGF